MFFRTVPTEFLLGKTRRFLTPSLCGAAGTNCEPKYYPAKSVANVCLSEELVQSMRVSM